MLPQHTKLFISNSQAIFVHAAMQAGVLPEPGSDERELGRRMTRQLSDVTAYVKHRPRVNSVEINPDDFLTDREVLAKRLVKYSLTERVVKGDGNCQVSVGQVLLRRSKHRLVCRSCKQLAA